MRLQPCSFYCLHHPMKIFLVKKNLSVVLEETNSQLSGGDDNNNDNEYMDSIPNLDERISKASNPSSSGQRPLSSASSNNNNSNSCSSSTSIATKTVWIDLWRALVAALFLQWLADLALFTRARKLITASEEDDQTATTSHSKSQTSRLSSSTSPSSSSVASSSSSSSP